MICRCSHWYQRDRCTAILFRGVADDVGWLPAWMHFIGEREYRLMGGYERALGEALGSVPYQLHP